MRRPPQDRLEKLAERLQKQAEAVQDGFLEA